MVSRVISNTTSFQFLFVQFVKLVFIECAYRNELGWSATSVSIVWCALIRINMEKRCFKWD